jgi:hypothetical protein
LISQSSEKVCLLLVDQFSLIDTTVLKSIQTRILSTVVLLRLNAHHLGWTLDFQGKTLVSWEKIEGIYSALPLPVLSLLSKFESVSVFCNRLDFHFPRWFGPLLVHRRRSSWKEPEV